MKNITRRNYRILCDHMDIWQFMVEIYEKDWRNGVAAPFLEYALSSSWMSKEYTHRSMIWKDNDRIVAFVFSESPVTDIYFSLRPGYEELAAEMVDYSAKNMPDIDGRMRFVLFQGQDAVMKAAEQIGFVKTGGYDDLIYDFDKPLDYKLPEGFSFAEPGKFDVAKMMECCWKGFNHEAEEGPWNGDAEAGYHLAQAPHATMQYPVAIQDENGKYACWAGMWWVPENHLAYMEPLCTVPEHRHKGLASAALSELYRRMKPLGATHMTGGDNPFYAAIGYKPMIKWTFWTRKKAGDQTN